MPLTHLAIQQPRPVLTVGHDLTNKFRVAMPLFPQLSVEDQEIHDSFGALCANKDSEWQRVDSFGAAYATVLGRHSLFLPVPFL
jgi:hypothetical protein